MSDRDVFTGVIFLIGMGLTLITLIGLLIHSRGRADFWLRVLYTVGLVALVYVSYFMVSLLFFVCGGPLVWLVMVCVILVRVFNAWVDLPPPPPSGWDSVRERRPYIDDIR